MKPKIVLCLALVLSGGFDIVRASESTTNAEPRYLDKSLSEWIPLGRSASGDVFIPVDGRSYTAVREVGTNAIPWLLSWVRSEKPETAQLGIEGFSMLGPFAKPAVPELIWLVNDWASSSAWSNAIPALAVIRDSNNLTCPFTFFLSAATNASAPAELRAQVIQCLAQIGYHMNGVGNLLQLGTNARLVVPVFIRCLQDKEWRVATAAADGLGYYTIEPLVAVPALAACLVSRTNASEVANSRSDWHGDVAVRVCAVRALCEFAAIASGQEGFHYNEAPLESSSIPRYREAMRPVVPVLIKALGDEDWRVAWSAADALGAAALEPELAVPALVKSMDYPQGNVREAAITALGNFGQAARSAVPALTKRAQDDPRGYFGGGAAANVLKKIVPQPKE